MTLETGDRRQIRVNQWGTSYLSFNDPHIHFGSVTRIMSIACTSAGPADVLRFTEIWKLTVT